MENGEQRAFHYHKSTSRSSTELTHLPLTHRQQHRWGRFLSKHSWHMFGLWPRMIISNLHAVHMIGIQWLTSDFLSDRKHGLIMECDLHFAVSRNLKTRERTESRECKRHMTKNKWCKMIALLYACLAFQQKGCLTDVQFH